MAVDLDHSFTTDKSIEESYAAITDLERVVPAVEGGSVLERTGPDSVKAQILLKMGAMSMKMVGTIELVEQDAAAHRAVMQVKARESGGTGHANADVTFQLADGGGTIHTHAQITGKAASMGEGVMVGVLDGLITDFTTKLGPDLIRWRRVVMREIREGEVPFAAGTAIQEDPGRPAFRGNGPDDYVCVQCGNVLAQAMDAAADDEEGPGECGRCRTVNVAVTGD